MRRRARSESDREANRKVGGHVKRSNPRYIVRECAIKLLVDFLRFTAQRIDTCRHA